MKSITMILGILLCCGCRSDVAQQDAIAIARSKGADVRISISGDAQRVDLRRCELDEELKKAIALMPAIETLLVGKAFSDNDLDVLDNLTALKNLDLSRTQVTVVGLERLAQFRLLEFLSLNGMTLSDADMEAVTTLRQLKSLSLVDAKVSEASVKKFFEQNPDCTVAQ